MEEVKRHDVEKILKEHDLKITRGRVETLLFLMQKEEPQTVEQIQSSVPHINIVTIYRTLEHYAQKGIVYKTDFRAGKAYFEYQKLHHHHITCTRCGTKEPIDFCVTANMRSVRKISKKFYTVDSHVLEFFGTCKKCFK
jgi:Fur family ferric uptake transcriptional regulator